MTRLDPSSISLERRGVGPPLVLLHCLGVDHHFWDFAGELARDFTLISYDLPGHGRSPVPAGRLHDRRPVGAAWRIARATQYCTRAYRGNFARWPHRAALCGDPCPHAVDRLILIDTTPRYTDELRAMWAERAAAARSAGVKALVDGLLKIWFTPQSDCRQHRSRPLRARGAAKNHPAKAMRWPARRWRPPTFARQPPRSRRRRWSFAATTTSRVSSMRRAGSQAISKARSLAWIAKARHASVIERPSEALALMRKFSARIMLIQPFRCWLKKSSVSFSARSASGLL